MLWGGHKKLGGPTVFLNDGILLKGRLHMELGCFLFSNCSLELQRLSTNSREAAQPQLKGSKTLRSLLKLGSCKAINYMLKPEIKGPSLAYRITPVLARAAFSTNTLVCLESSTTFCSPT